MKNLIVFQICSFCKYGRDKKVKMKGSVASCTECHRCLGFVQVMFSHSWTGVNRESFTNVLFWL